MGLQAEGKELCVNAGQGGERARGGGGGRQARKKLLKAVPLFCLPYSGYWGQG